MTTFRPDPAGAVTPVIPVTPSGCQCDHGTVVIGPAVSGADHFTSRAVVAALSDGGGVRHALLRPVVGIDNVARLLAVSWWKRDTERSVELVQINGGPGLLVRVDGEIDGVVAVRVENGCVTGAYHVRNPEKLSRVERETAVSRLGRNDLPPAALHLHPGADQALSDAVYPLQVPASLVGIEVCAASNRQPVLRNVPVWPLRQPYPAPAGAIEVVSAGPVAVRRLLLGARMRGRDAHASQLGGTLAQDLP